MIPKRRSLNISVIFRQFRGLEIDNLQHFLAFGTYTSASVLVYTDRTENMDFYSGSLRFQQASEISALKNGRKRRVNIHQESNLMHCFSAANVRVFPSSPTLLLSRSPALPLSRINLPLFTSIVNMEYLVKNKTDFLLIYSVFVSQSHKRELCFFPLNLMKF